MPAKLINTSLPSIRREKSRRHLRDFAQYFWDVVEPATPLIWDWPLDAVCDHLEAITLGQIRDLIINIPPRCLKSTLVSVMWPAWEWLQDPTIRYLTSSYDKTLAIRDAVRSRRLIEHPKYRELNVDENGDQRFLLSGDQNVKSRYENTQTGHRICTSPSSAGTGEGGNRIVVDDPHNVKEAESDEQREGVIDWWDKTMSTRRNDLKLAARVVIMQRLHFGDLTAHCLELGYDHVCLPLHYRSDHPHPCRSRIGFTDPRTEDGEVLMPGRFGEAEIADINKSLGTPAAVAAQYEQMPAPAEGVIFKRSWFGRYKAQPILEECDLVFTSWDASFKGSTKEEIKQLRERSFVVGLLFAVHGSTVYVIDRERGRWDFLETLQAFARLMVKWPSAKGHLIEDKANGPAIVSVFKSRIRGLNPVEPHGSKVQRAYACMPSVSAGNVLLPEDGWWVEDFLDELTRFPFTTRNDQVDAFTQGMNWSRERLSSSSISLMDRLIGLG